MLIKQLWYANDVNPIANSLEDMKDIMDTFSATSEKFGLTISLKKTEVRYSSSRLWAGYIYEWN